MNKNLLTLICKKATPFVLAIVLTGCSCNKSWDFKTRYFRMDIDNRGYITGMKNITVSPAREFSPADKPSPVMSLYNTLEKEYYYPSTASYDRNAKILTVEYTNGSVAKISIRPQNKYIKMTLESLDPRNGVDGVQWGSYYTNITNLLGEVIGVARDTSEKVNYSIGMLALDDNTLGGTSDLEGDAAPFQYIIHTPDPVQHPLPNNLHEGQVFTLGGDGISDVAFFAHKEPYYRIMYGNAAMVDDKGRIFLNYHSRDRTFKRQVAYSLIPNMSANIPNHIEVEPVPGVDFIGSSIAFWGSPDSTALMDVIQDIVLAEGLPYPQVNGRWVKDPAAYVPDAVAYGNKYDSIIAYVERLGFKSIHAYDLGSLKVDRGNKGYIDGKNFERKPFSFTSGNNKSHKEFSDQARAKNVLLGRSNITTALPPGTMDTSPVPSDSLCYQQKRVLMRDISATDTMIIVDDPTYLEEIGSWEGHWKELNMVKIGKELIHYLGVSTTEPYTLLNVTRGYWGTKATAHPANDTVYKLQVTLCFGYDGLIPNLALQDKVAEYYADVCAINGIGLCDFDGQEFLFNNGHGYYSAKRFFRKMFERANENGMPSIRFTGATLSEASWHYQSIWNVGGGKNLYDIDTREWGSTTSQGKDLRDMTYSNYYPSSFGVNFAIKDTSTVEQYEHIQAISTGVGATYYMWLGQDDVESCPQKNAIFKAIRTWEDARSANAFPSHIRKMLADPAYDWTLEAGSDKDSWTLYRLIDGKRSESYQLKRAAGY